MALPRPSQRCRDTRMDPTVGDEIVLVVVVLAAGV